MIEYCIIARRDAEVKRQGGDGGTFLRCHRRVCVRGHKLRDLARAAPALVLVPTSSYAI